MRIFYAATVFIALFFLMFTTHAENTRANQKIIEKQISSTKATLKSARATSKKLKDDVSDAESELNEISKLLHETDTKINQLTSKLIKLIAQKDKLLTQTGEQKKALAQQMQALYTSGKQSHLRLLLKQDDPSDISRTVKYFEYMNSHRMKRIQEIKARLTKIHIVQSQINEDKQALTKLQEQQGEEKQKLKIALAKHEKAFKAQRKTVYTQEQKLKKLQQEETRLKNVFARLAARQAIAEKNRKQEIERQKQASKASSAPEVTTHYVPDAPFASLKGKLSWPVRGRLTQRYGSARNSKQRWKGVIISAPGGSQVQAVARGKVEFSGRLNGYGYLIIIRHDNNYRSLYAYNRSVYKKEGEVVKAGEVIAAVGNTGNERQNGLYFEIRKGTSHQNPGRWCR